MSLFRYRPADAAGWLAAWCQGQLLVVHPRAADIGVVVFENSQAADATPGFQAALDELTRGGLSATPPFALLEWSGDGDDWSVRVIVRGGVQVVVSSADTQHTLDGTGVSTWTEQSFQKVTGFEVVITGVPGVLKDSIWLPLDRGTALVARIASDRADATPAVEAAVRTAQPTASAPQTSPQPSAATPAGDSTVSEATIAPIELHADARPTDEGYDYLFGETMYRTVSDAAVREADPEAEAVAESEQAADTPAGDHDGMTIMTGDLVKLRGGRKSRGAAAAPAEPPASVLFLELSTGSREGLTQPLLVGRAPTASKVSGGALPRLVTIPGDKDISRNHAQFTVEGGTVVVTDLHSRNGTQVVMPGKPPQQLRQGEPTAVIVGTVVDLGGGVTLTVREEA